MSKMSRARQDLSPARADLLDGELEATPAVHHPRGDLVDGAEDEQHFYSVRSAHIYQRFLSGVSMFRLLDM